METHFESIDGFEVLSLETFELLLGFKLAVLLLDGRQVEHFLVTRFHTTWCGGFLRIKCLGFYVDFNVCFRVSFTVAEWNLIGGFRRVVCVFAEIEVCFTEELAFVLCENCKDRLLLAELVPEGVPVDGCFHLELLVKHSLRVVWTYRLHFSVDALRTYCESGYKSTYLSSREFAH